MSKNSYIKGASIIAVGGIIAKLLGLFFKIPIGRILDSYGYGLYYNSYNIYNLLLTISVIGVPVAISKMVAERVSVKNYLGVYNVFKISMVALFILGAISSVIMYFGARWIINMAGWHIDTYYSIIGLSLAPLFVAIMCSIRGFFQGMQIMTPSAISQIIESIIRVVFGIGLCYYLTNSYNQAIGAGGASAGATIAAIFTSMFLLFVFMIYLKDFNIKIKQSKKTYKNESVVFLLKRLAQIAVPVTLASAVVSLFGLVNSFMYVPRLDVAGFDKQIATVLFGDYGLAQTMVNVPLTFSSAMAITLVPAISESFVLKDIRSIKYKSELGIRIIILISMPCAIGLSILSQPIFDMLFPSAEYGGDILKYLSFTTILIMITNTLQSILQGLDKFMIPVKNLLIGLGFKYIFNYILIAMPSVNIYGLVLSNLGAYLISSILNYRSLKKYIGIKINYNQTIIKPLTASLIMAIVGINTYNVLLLFLDNSFAVITTIVVCAFAYLIVLIVIKGLTKEELEIMPVKGKIKSFIEKFL